jgi:pimeloyl-ACP methyl ester carboxylesterase
MFVRIGGIEQWITIEGDNGENPVVLFLHGGPGDADSPFADSLYRGWEREFTLVQWDQRGAGRTYTKNGPSIEPTMTMDRMVQDGIEVAEFLAHHLHKPKIVVVGISWGSILGASMVHARPDLFYAYVGVAQMVNWIENVQASYTRVLELARRADDQPAIATLTAVGPPPWNAISKWPQFRKWQRAYQAKNVKVGPPNMTRNPAYDSPDERAQYDEADDFSFIHFVGLDMSGPLTHVDLSALGTDFEIPLFIVQGEQDLVAVPYLARAFLDRLTAPQKEFYLVPGAGHAPSSGGLSLILQILREEVRPLIRKTESRPQPDER